MSRLGLFSLGSSLPQGEAIAVSQCLQEGCNKVRGKCFNRSCCDRRSSNGFKLREDWYRLDIRREFHTVKVVKHWIGLPSDEGDVPPLEIFNTRLDGALSSLAGDGPVLCRGWTGQCSKVLSLPINSMILCLDVLGSQRGP